MSLRLLPAIACVLLLVAPTVTFGQAPGDAYHWVCFGSKGPLLIRLRVLFDGRPQSQAFAEAQRDYVEKVFRYLDQDADGVLSADEAQYAPPPQFAVDSATMQDPAEFHFAFNFLALDVDRDGGLSAAELAGYVAGYSDGAVRLQTEQPAADAGIEQAFRRLLRADGGAVAAEQLRGLERLLERDTDGDETLSAAELLGPQAVAANEAPPTRSAGATGALRAFAAPRSGGQVAAALLAAYRKSASASATLGPDDAVWGEARWKMLDADGSGRLDAAELARYLEGPADVELIQELSSVSGGPALRIAEQAPSPGVEATIAASGRACSINTADARIQFAVRQTGDSGAFCRQAVLEHFADYDADGDGKLQAGEGARSMFAPVVAAMDRDGDTAIDAAECQRYLDEFLVPYVRVSACRAAYWTSAPGGGLFAALDADRDGRLDRNELVAAAAASFDRDGDGRLQTIEIPRSYLVRGASDSADRRRPSFDPLLPSELTQRMFADLPVWFVGMDGNGDGEVSWREFLGQRARFSALDADGDLSISADEARVNSADVR